MQVEAIIAELEQNGVVLAAVGDEVRLRAPADRVPSPAVIAELRQQKPAVLVYLRTRTGAGQRSFSVFQTPIEQKTEKLKPSPQATLPESDPYAERMRATLKQINRRDYPAGMVLWLEKADPHLYRELTEYLPEDIHRLWEAHVPLEEFEYTLERLVATHQRAVALYCESTGRSP